LLEDEFVSGHVCTTERILQKLKEEVKKGNY
jgi:hypothetical protein